jgi:aconitate hydratase
MGQAPATGRISLRTVPRNFPGRSGTREDQVYLCSPETATASALSGEITDPRSLAMACPHFTEPDQLRINTEMLQPPLPDGSQVELQKGPNIRPLPELGALPEQLTGPVLLKVGDDISTDEILPAGARVLPYRSNIEAIARFLFEPIDETCYSRAQPYRDTGFFVIGGHNYGQGSSREHAALAPRSIGLRAVIARSFARIHQENLINFGVLPLVFTDAGDYEQIEQGDELSLPGLRARLTEGAPITVRNHTRKRDFETRYTLSPRQVEMILSGSLIESLRKTKLGQQQRVS